MTLLAAVRALLDRAVAEGVTPGAQLAVVDPRGRLHGLVVGALGNEPGAPAVTPETLYDLASVTKAVVALALVRCGVDLAAPLATVLPEARGAAVGEATLDALLAHRAGLIPWAPFYERVPVAAAGTPEARRAVLDAVLATTPGSAGEARYSDLGYVLLGEALARATGLPLDAAVRREVLAPLGLSGAIGYRGVGWQWRAEGVAPTERCPWRGRVVQGEVHDENAYALGGVAGHAGLFGTAAALAGVGRAALGALAGRSAWLPRAAMEGMLRPRPGGTQRLGWDGRSAVDSTAGTHMGPRTFGHLGFTGTSLWCDPEAGVVVALVTNRVHPTRTNTGIRALRPAVHDAVMAALGC